jgi:hypothetical protein
MSQTIVHSTAADDLAKTVNLAALPLERLAERLDFAPRPRWLSENDVKLSYDRILCEIIRRGGNSAEKKVPPTYRTGRIDGPPRRRVEAPRRRGRHQLFSCLLQILCGLGFTELKFCAIIQMYTNSVWPPPGKVDGSQPRRPAVEHCLHFSLQADISGGRAINYFPPSPAALASTLSRFHPTGSLAGH